MNLYEITNGYIGESYVRCYVWAQDEAEAWALFAEKHKDENEARRTIRNIRQLMSGDSPAFCTVLSDSGWWWEQP